MIPRSAATLAAAPAVTPAAASANETAAANTSLTLLIALLAFILGLVLGAVISHLVRTRNHARPGAPGADSPGVGQLPSQHPPSQPPQQQSQQPAIDPQRELAPLHHAVAQLSEQLKEMNEDRVAVYSALTSQVQAVTRASSRLGDRTDQLITALRSPQVRGRWGEMQLERVVELGGMVKYCDFDVQQTARVDGHLMRPDMLIRLSRGRNIIVDAKVPFGAYLDALTTEDPEEREAFLRRHSHLLRAHVATLSQKSYVAAFQPTPEFVVMFVPADPFLDAALAQDPQLLDDAFASGVVIATPTTLIALLKTVGLGWQHEDISDKAHEVQRLGAQLYTRLNTMAEHYNRLGSSLDKAVEAFNSTLGSMDSRVLVTARRLKDLDLPAQSTSTPVNLKPVSARARYASGGQEHGGQENGAHGGEEI